MADKTRRIERRNFLKSSLATVPLAAAISSCSTSNASDTPCGGLENKEVYISAACKEQRIAEELKSYLSQLEIIDTHEHLVCESMRLEKKIDVLGMMNQYEYVDMLSAGLKPLKDKHILLDDSITLEQRWKLVWPYLQNIKSGSYYRAYKIALKDLYGIDDLNENTYQVANEKIQDAAKPGLYKKILRDKCNIKTCLVQNTKVIGQDPPGLLTPVFDRTAVAVAFWDKTYINELNGIYDVDISGFDEFVEYFKRHIKWSKDNGAVGCKVRAEPTVRPDIERARKDFGAFLKGDHGSVVLKSTALDVLFKTAAELDFPVAVHTGVWGDFRNLDPKNFIEPIVTNPDVRFDLYHLGMPYVRDIIFIAKNFPNVHLNLCWAYVLSEHISQSSVNEIIDTVPVNKIFGFGGDYIWSVEHVYGHLMMARDVLSQALAKPIASGRMDIAEAKRILKLWMYDNPASFYSIA